MKTILLWDPRFPDRRPARLTVEDTVASAAVRAGVAAAANPAEAGTLAAGGALDPGSLTEVALQHGSGKAIRRVFIPYSVALVGAAAGVLAAIGVPLAGGTTPPPLPTLTLTGPLTYATNAAAGTLVANIGNVPAGVTPTLTPNDGRLVITGSAGAWTVVTGISASTAGTITLAVAAAGANGASVGVTVVAGFQAPATNQRVALTGTPQSSVADATLVTALTNMASQRTLPAFSARVVKLPIEAVPNGARAYFTSSNRDVTARQSLDSTNGTDGTWTALTVTNCQGGGSGPAGLVIIPSGAARWLEITCSIGVGAFGLFHLAANGLLPDMFVQAGASHTDGGMKPLLMRARAILQFPTRDPIFMNEGQAAQGIAIVRLNAQNALVRWPEAIGYMCDSLIGNDVTGQRPYTTAQQSSLSAQVNGMYSDILTAGKKVVSASNMTFRRYFAPNDVNNGANPENGTLPYNVNVMHPALSTIGFMNSTTLEAYTDVYSLLLYYQQTLIDDGNDQIHPTVEGYAEMCDEHIRQDFAYYWTGMRAAPSSSRLLGLLETLSNALDPTTYKFWLWSSYFVRDLPASAHKTAQQARINATEPAARLVDATNAVIAFEAGKTPALKTAATDKLALVLAPPYASQKTSLQNRINAVVVVANTIAIVSFGSNTAAAPANNSGVINTTGQKIANMKNIDGADTGWSLFITEGSNGTNGNGGVITGNNSGAFADDVLAGAAYNSGPSDFIEMEFRGLDSTKTYNIDVTGSTTDTNRSNVIRTTLNGTALTGAGGITMPTFNQLNFSGQVSSTGVPVIDLGSGVMGIRLYNKCDSGFGRISGLRITQVNT